MTEGEIKVLIAEYHRLVREGLVALFSRSDGFVVVGEADDGQMAIERVMRLRPDVAILDISLPTVDGIEATRRITQTTVPTRVVMLTAGDEGSEDEARKAGAYGFVGKDLTSFEDLAEVVRRAARRDPPGALPAGTDADQPVGGIITPREREIAVLLADGYSTKEAAGVLGISVRTAETHRAAVMRKLGARNVADVVKYCIRNHLIDV